MLMRIQMLTCWHGRASKTGGVGECPLAPLSTYVGTPPPPLQHPWRKNVCRENSRIHPSVLSLFSTFVYRGSSHRCKSAACPKSLAVSLTYPNGEEGANFLVQMIFYLPPSPWGKVGGGRHPVVLTQVRGHVFTSFSSRKRRFSLCYFIYILCCQNHW